MMIMIMIVYLLISQSIICPFSVEISTCPPFPHHFHKFISIKKKIYTTNWRKYFGKKRTEIMII